MAKGFDTTNIQDAASQAQKIKAAGYTWIAGYYFYSSSFKQLLTRSAATKLSQAGMYVVAVYESGQPTNVGYFTHVQGQIDAHRALACAESAGQPAGTPIYFAVDYDAAQSDLYSITSYIRSVYSILSGQGGYRVGVYGSGLVCQHLTEAGLVSHTWLSQSHGFSGYGDWEPVADIIQGPETRLFGLDCDADESNGNAGGWQVPAT